MAIDAHDRVSPLADLHGLNREQHRQLSLLLELIQLDDTAPTSPQAASAALDVHLADSLIALEVDAVRRCRLIADLGSGAGFPGLPLAIALPEARIHLIESQERKCAFIRRSILALGVSNAAVIQARAESWPSGLGQHDLIVARAIGPQSVVLEYAAPLLALQGLVADWRGRRDAGEEQAAQVAAAELGMEQVEVRRVEPYAGARDHHLHLYIKVRDTPERFPRRTGMARKRPLGSKPLV